MMMDTGFHISGGRVACVGQILKGEGQPAGVGPTGCLGTPAPACSPPFNAQIKEPPTGDALQEKLRLVWLDPFAKGRPDMRPVQPRCSSKSGKGRVQEPRTRRVHAQLPRSQADPAGHPHGWACTGPGLPSVTATHDTTRPTFPRWAGPRAPVTRPLASLSEGDRTSRSTRQ